MSGGVRGRRRKPPPTQSFYEVAMEKREDDAYLVTGNQKHYPIREFIVTPAEMLEIIEK